MTDISAPPRPDSDDEKRLRDPREEYRQKMQVGRALDGADEATKQTRINLLARLIFAEAADHHSIAGAMEGIGWATINRVGAPTFPKTLEAVIYQPKQFDSVGKRLWKDAADPSKLTGPNSTAYAKALRVAEGILGGKIPDRTGAAQFFYSSPDDKVRSPFFKDRLDREILERSPDQPIGRFYFLRPRAKQ